MEVYGEHRFHVPNLSFAYNKYTIICAMYKERSVSHIPAWWYTQQVVPEVMSSLSDSIMRSNPHPTFKRWVKEEKPTKTVNQL